MHGSPCGALEFDVKSTAVLKGMFALLLPNNMSPSTGADSYNNYGRQRSDPSSVTRSGGALYANRSQDARNI